MPTTPQGVVDSIDKGLNHSAYALPNIPETDLKVKTMKIISSQRQFFFYHGTIQVFELNGDKYSSLFYPQQHIQSGLGPVFYRDKL